MSLTQTYIGVLHIHTCGECGVVFGMDQAFYERKKNDHTVWFCPNGHERIFMGKSEAEKLREELASKERQMTWKQKRIDDLQNEKLNLSNQVRAQKGAKTRLFNRAKNGVCPCCNRTFSNLANHMKTKHPETCQKTHF